MPHQRAYFIGRNARFPTWYVHGGNVFFKLRSRGAYRPSFDSAKDGPQPPDRLSRYRRAATVTSNTKYALRQEPLIKRGTSALSTR